jgi:hypothetical protein
MKLDRSFILLFRRRGSIEKLVKIIAVFVVLFLSFPKHAIGQQATPESQLHYVWSPAKQIPEYTSMRAAPYLVADRNRTVHAFNLERGAGQQPKIFYRNWTVLLGWSKPIDILLPDTLGGSPTLQGVHLEDNGTLNLIIYAGDAQEGNIYYTTANVLRADQADAWASPAPVAVDAGPLAAAAITGDGKGKLVVVYSGYRYGIGIYEVHSLDGGETWSAPTVVSLSNEQNAFPRYISLETDDLGRIHAAWHLVDDSGQILEARYARLDADFKIWEHGMVLSRRETELEFYGWPAVISSGNVIYVVYTDDFPPTRFVRRSNDGGKSWAPPVRPFPHQGDYEQPILLKDSSGKIHMIIGNRLPDPVIHGMWHSRLVDNHWTPLFPIVSGPVTNLFDPTGPQAVISQGNVLLATWTNDVGREYRTGAWYSYTFVDAPELPVQSHQIPSTILKTPAVSSDSPGETQAPLTETQPQYPRSFGDVLKDLIQDNNPNIFVFLGIVPVLLLVVGTIITHYARRR